MLSEKNAVTKIWFVGKSGDSKTGIVSATYSSENTCPARCPFKNNGCYAENFRCAANWKKVSEKGVTPSELKNVIDNTKHCDVVRHNIAGDIAKNHSNNIDKNLVKNLCNAYKNMKAAYTYTHTAINKHNIDIVKEAAEKNFVINFSTENIKDCKKAIAAGCNAVIAVNTMSQKVVKKDGITIVQCPATCDKNKHCANCGLCWQKNRKFAVAFPVHGNGKGKAQRAGFLTDI